jgi:hypothetical protein
MTAAHVGKLTTPRHEFTLVFQERVVHPVDAAQRRGVKLDPTLAGLASLSVQRRVRDSRQLVSQALDVAYHDFA